MKTSEFWTGIESYIFFTTQDGWQKRWDVLMYEDEPVTSLTVAKQLVRKHMKNQMIGLAEFDQMKINNAQWDNL